MENLIIGSHVSFKKSDQLLGSLKEALRFNANAFMIYTGAPQNTQRSSIDKNITKEAHTMLIENNIDIDNVIVHAPYIVNLANGNDFAISFLKQEVDRVVELGLKNIVLHPGSHVALSREEGIKNIIYGLNQIIYKDFPVFILLEVMAGKGSEIGRNFHEIKEIIDGVKYNEYVKVCLDTCHLNDAGYNISEFDKVLEEFDKIVGISKIACVHINDSKNNLGDSKDRHENFGFGTIGFDNLINVIYHEKLTNVPKILETPYVTETETSKEKIYPPYKQEIEMIKSKKLNNNLIEDIRNYYKKF